MRGQPEGARDAAQGAIRAAAVRGRLRQASANIQSRPSKSDIHAAFNRGFVKTEKDYILGTHDAELERLGLQHRVWRPRTTDTWRRAGFTTGQSLIDVGCGPGYAALDLAEIVGPTGHVLGIDRSRRYLDALESWARTRGLENVKALELDLDESFPSDVRADGAWSRWVYAFVREPQRLLGRVAAALKPGGVMAMYEYADYRTWRVSPRRTEFEAFVSEVVASWHASGGEPDVGFDLPRWLEALEFDLIEVRPIVEVARPGDFLWEWPRAFVEVGLERLISLGRVDAERAAAMRRSWIETEATPGAFLFTPTVIEIIARKR